MIWQKRKWYSNEKNDDPNNAIEFGDGSQGNVKGFGKIAITISHSITNVFLVDSFYYNLFSVSQLCEIGYSWKTVAILRSDESVVFEGVLKETLYLVHF